MFEALNVATNPLERMRENLLNSSTRFHGQNCKTLFIYFNLKLKNSKARTSRQMARNSLSKR